MAHRALAQLLEPLSPEDFFAGHWQRRAAHVAAASDKISQLAALAPFAWLSHARELEAAGRDAHEQQRQVAISAGQVEALYCSGMTICADVSSHPQIAPWLQRLGNDFALAGGRPFGKMYASPDGMGFAPHFDMFHVFVVQISGKKRWRYGSEPAVHMPLSSAKLDRQGNPVWAYPREGIPCDEHGQPLPAPDLDSFHDVTLTPGDVLYLPPGTWHAAAAVDHSLALSISPQRAPIGQLILKALEEQLLEQPAWRDDLFTAQPLAHQGASDNGIASPIQQRLGELGNTLNHFDARIVQRLWRINVAADLPPNAEQPTATDLHDGSRLQLGSAQLNEYLIAPGDDGQDALFFYGAGEEWSLPIEARAFIAALVEHPEFTVKEAYAWDPTLGHEDVVVILEQLVEVGLLEPLSTA